MIKSHCWIWIVPHICGLQSFIGTSSSTHLNLNLCGVCTGQTVKPCRVNFVLQPNWLHLYIFTLYSFLLTYEPLWTVDLQPPLRTQRSWYEATATACFILCCVSTRQPENLADDHSRGCLKIMLPAIACACGRTSNKSLTPGLVWKLELRKTTSRDGSLHGKFPFGLTQQAIKLFSL